MSGSKTSAFFVSRVLIAFLVVFFSLIYSRIVYQSRNALIEGENALKSSNYLEAVYLFKKSVENYAPFNPFRKTALERLWQLGNKAELINDRYLAVFSYMAIRTALLSSRTFFIPDNGMLNDVNLKISLMMTEISGTNSFDKTNKDEIQRKYINLLSVVRDGNVSGFVILEIGFWLWILSIVFFFLRGFNDSFQIISSRLFYSIIMFVIGFILWISGLLLS